MKFNDIFRDFLDYIVIGDGELSLSLLCHALEDGTDPAAVPNLVYFDREKDAAVSTGFSCARIDMDSLAYPDYTGYCFDEYFTPEIVSRSSFPRGVTGVNARSVITLTDSRGIRRSILNGSLQNSGIILTDTARQGLSLWMKLSRPRFMTALPLRSLQPVWTSVIIHLPVLRTAIRRTCCGICINRAQDCSFGDMNANPFV